MSGAIRCPHCQQSVTLRPDCAVAWLTCADCHAIFQNPHVNPGEEPLPPPPTFAAITRPTSCPRCQKKIEPHFLFCPHCEEPLRETRDGPIIKPDDVPSPFGSTGRIFLAILGLFPFLSLVGTIIAVIFSGDVGSMIGIGFLLWVPGILGGLVAISRANKRGEPISVLSVFTGILTVFGVFMVASFALMVFAFFICALGSASRC